MSAAERDALLAAAEPVRTALVEDRVLADLPFDGQAPPPFAALWPGSAVATIGSISKVLWGGLAAHLRTRRRAMDLGSPAPMQVAAAWLLDHHYDDTRTWRIRRLRESLAALTTAISTAGLGWQYQRPAGGPNLWSRLPNPTARGFAERSARDGVPLAAGSTFTITPGTASDMIRIPFYLPPTD